MSVWENKLERNVPTLPIFYWLTGYPKQLFLDLISVELNDKQKSILNYDKTRPVCRFLKKGCQFKGFYRGVNLKKILILRPKLGV